MILVDSAVWIAHFKRREDWLITLLESQQVLGHPAVLAELALGSIPDRAKTLSNIGDLPQSTVADSGEVLALIETARLEGTGIGYADAHLLASTLLSPNSRLWTKDRRLQAVALRLGIAATPT